MRRLKRVGRGLRKGAAFLIGGIGVLVVLLGMGLLLLTEGVDPTTKTFPC